jgi:hypothetical protein
MILRCCCSAQLTRPQLQLSFLYSSSGRRRVMVGLKMLCGAKWFILILSSWYALSLNADTLSPIRVRMSSHGRRERDWDWDIVGCVSLLRSCCVILPEFVIGGERDNRKSSLDFQVVFTGLPPTLEKNATQGGGNPVETP